MIALKHSVSVAGVRPQTVLALMIAADMFRVFKKDCIVQRIHPDGCGIDLRVRNFDKQDRISIANSLVSVLGNEAEYTVKHEKAGTEDEFISIHYNA